MFLFLAQEVLHLAQTVMLLLTTPR